MSVPSGFTYELINVSNLLPERWYDKIFTFCQENYEVVYIKPSSITSRELNANTEICTHVVNGITVKSKLTWFYDLYENEFKSIAEEYLGSSVYVAKDALYGVNFNLQHGMEMRYECHVDSNPLQGVFFVTSHSLNEGGTLIVSNNEKAVGVKQITADSISIHPQSGYLALFDATKHPHYVSALSSKDGVRISGVFNFYTDENPENNRPDDLSNHLFKGV